MPISAGLGSFLGGAVSGVAGLSGALIEGAYQKKYQQRQMQHDKDMAGINQSYIKEQMDLQNQYQVEQWNRENAYNDPSAVAERFMDAGINPRAVMGGSATGTGVAGGLSSAPTGSAPGHSSSIIAKSPNFSGALSGMVTDAMRIKSTLNEQRRIDSENRLRESQARKTEFETTHLLPVEKKLKEADLTGKEIDNYWKPLEKEASVALTNKNLLLATQQINESVARQTKLVAESDLTKEQKKLVTEQINMTKEQAEKYLQESILASVNAHLAQSNINLNSVKAKQLKALTQKVAVDIGMSRLQGLQIYENYLDKYYRNEIYRKTGTHADYFDPGNYAALIGYAMSDLSTFKKPTRPFYDNPMTKSNQNGEKIWIE